MNAKQKPLLCHLGRHKWRTRHNDAGQAYQTCMGCGKDRDLLIMARPFRAR